MYRALHLDFALLRIHCKYMSRGTNSSAPQIPPIRFSDENQRTTFLDTMNTEKLTVTQPASPSLPDTYDGTADRSPEGDSLDGLIAELDAGDEHELLAEEDPIVAVGAPRLIPNEHLQTDIATGLSDSEVSQRRKKYGWNQMSEEKQSHVKEFLFFFVGPIQFVMEVTISTACHWTCEG